MVQANYPGDYDTIRDYLVFAMVAASQKVKSAKAKGNSIDTAPAQVLAELETLQRDLNQLATEADLHFTRLNALKTNVAQSDSITIYLPTGSYEITQINDEVTRHFATQGLGGSESPPFTISSNPATLSSVINITDSRYTIDMSKSSISTVLGFSGRILRKGRHESDQPVNILPISSILVKCSIVSGSYVGGSEHPLLYSFFPEVSPGYKVIERPQHVVYLPVTLTGNIQNIRIWLSDQNHNPLDLRGELITLRCALVAD
jgi:hypothetical protein